MTTYIKDLIHLPERVHRGDFVLNLADGVRHARQTLDTYVVTPQLATCFRNAMGFIKSALDAKASRAAYLHGSFGAGKSHFMAVLHLLLQHDPLARTRDELAPVCAENAWAEGRKFLLVPYHMIGSQNLESAILGGYARFVGEQHPDAPWPGVFKGDALLEDAQAHRAEIGDERFFGKLNQSSCDDGWGSLDEGWDAERFERAVAARPGDPLSERQQLVGDLVKYVFPAYRTLADGRGEAFVSLDEGLSILSQHAHRLGYDAVILFLDELILWLASRAADVSFVHREGQKLAKLVESASAHRPIPIVSFVARQRDLRELVGTHITGVEQLNFGDALKHWEGRFHTITLEDRNLPDIAEKRVLKPKSADARRQLDEAFEKTRRERQSVLNVLLTTKATPEMFRKVYPFSPALVETLVAVSSALQRERTALKVMLELLVQQRDTLELGQLIPVGDLFDIVAYGEEAFSDCMRLNFDNAKRLYTEKLLPILEEEHGIVTERDLGRQGQDPTLDLKLRTFRADDRLVKTVLLAALVPEVESLKSLTGERLAALNHGSLKTPIPGTEKSMVIQRFRRWAGRVGEIRISGDSANPTFSVQLTGVDTESILLQAQAEDNKGNRQLMIRRLLFDALDVKTPEEAAVSYDVVWRGTRRTVQLLYANVRDLTDYALQAQEDGWKVVIDWPFDDAGFSPDHDLGRLDRYQAENGKSTRTILWLPSFFSTRALDELGTLVKLEHILSGERFNQYATHLAPADRPVARQILENQRSALHHKMLTWLEMVYGMTTPASEVIYEVVEASNHVKTLCAGFEPRPPVGADFKAALLHILDQALSFQFPAHPVFEPENKEIRPAQLKTVWEQLQKAVEASDGRLYVEDRVRIPVRQVVVPMRIGEMGENHLVLGRHWLSHFNRKAEEHKRALPSVQDLYDWMDEPQPMGLQVPFRNLLVRLYAEQTRRSFVLYGTMKAPDLLEIRPEMELHTQKLPSESDWERAVALALALLGVKAPRVLNAANVAKLREGVSEAASAYHECGALVDKLLVLMNDIGIDDPRSSKRMQTARAARDFVASCEEPDAVALMSKIAHARVETGEVTMRASLETTSRNVAALRSLQTELFDGLRRLNDSRGADAETILHTLREAVAQDEFGAKLEPALRHASSAAARLLARVPHPPAVTPPPVVATPPATEDSRPVEPPRPSRPELKQLAHLEERSLPARAAREKMQKLLAQLPDDALVDLTWTVWMKS